MKITVTQDDIDNGESGSPYGCPVALAIKREAQKRVTVNACFIHCGCRLLDTPYSAAEFIVAFDTGNPVEPFTFEL